MKEAAMTTINTNYNFLAASGYNKTKVFDNISTDFEETSFDEAKSTVTVGNVADNTAKTFFYAQMFGAESLEEKPSISKSEVAEEFLDFMSKTPEERMWELFLKQKGITQEEFESLSLEEQQKIIQEFKEKIEEKFKEDVNASFIG